MVPHLAGSFLIVNFMCMDVLPESMNMYCICTWCSWGPKDGVGSLGSIVIVMSWAQGPLKEQQVLLTLIHPCLFLFVWFFFFPHRPLM